MIPNMKVTTLELRVGDMLDEGPIVYVSSHPDHDGDYYILVDSASRDYFEPQYGKFDADWVIARPEQATQSEAKPTALPASDALLVLDSATGTYKMYRA